MLLFGLDLSMSVKLDLIAKLLPPGAFPALFALPGMLLPTSLPGSLLHFRQVPSQSPFLRGAFPDSSGQAKSPALHVQMWVLLLQHLPPVLGVTLLCSLFFQCHLSLPTERAPGQRLGLSCSMLSLQHLALCLVQSNCSVL